ncbi:MAG: hypothetical protein M3Y50_14580, partial [Acidobacteriota bacterium]|nr:hypothetical protein [Acidobacteriota bacterium]
MYNQLDAGSLLEGLGEVTLFAPGDDVIAECLEVAVGDDGDSEGGVLAAVLGDAAAGCVADGTEEGDGLIWSDRATCAIYEFVVVVVFVVVRGQSEQQSGQFSATIDQSD